MSVTAQRDANSAAGIQGKEGREGGLLTDAQHLRKRLYDARVPHEWAECGLEHLQLSGAEEKYKDGLGCTRGPGQEATQMCAEEDRHDRCAEQKRMLVKK